MCFCDGPKQGEHESLFIHELVTLPPAPRCAGGSPGHSPQHGLWRGCWPCPRWPLQCPGPRAPLRLVLPAVLEAASTRAGPSPGTGQCGFQEDWHSLEISGKSHSPPGRCPKPTWHPAASLLCGRQDWGALGKRRAAWLPAHLAPSEAELGPPRPEGMEKRKREGEEEKEAPASGA